MVKKIAILVIGIVAVLLIVAALRVTRRSGDNDRITREMSSAIGTALPSQKEPLTEDEVLKCFLAFEEIGDAYSNLQFETMQEIFCGISNNVARLGKSRLDKAIETLLISFRNRFWWADINAMDFTNVSEFDRFIRANIWLFSVKSAVWRRSTKKRRIMNLRGRHRDILTRGKNTWHLVEVLQGCSSGWN